MHGVLFIFSYYFLNLRSIIFLQSPEQVRIDRSKCEHAVANRMLAFESVRLHLLLRPDRFFHVQLPRFASQHHAFSCRGGLSMHATCKYLKNTNLHIRVSELQLGTLCCMGATILKINLVPLTI